MIPDTVYRKAATPSYIFDLEALSQRVAQLRACLGSRVRIVFAMKANPFLVRALLPLVDGFEVCSPGEERICRRIGVPGEKMVLSGVNKEEADVDAYVRCYGAEALYTVESELQMERLEAAARRHHCTLGVLLRLSGGNQFGMEEAAVRKLIGQRDRFPGLVIRGLQYFSGTQKRLKRICQELDELDALIGELEGAETEEGGFPIAELEYGPGLPVSYFIGDKGPSDEELLTALAGKLQELKFGGRITLEIGRFLAAPCGSYLTSVRDLKKGSDAAYCIVDGGIHQMNYFGQMMGMKLPRMRLLAADRREAPASASGSGDGCAGALLTGEAGPDAVHWTVCGSLCTTADVLVRDLPLKELHLFDTLLFERTGAYSVTEGISLFLSRDLPRVYFYENGELALIREQLFTEEWNSGRIDQDS